MDPVCKAFNHGNVNICFNHGVGKRMGCGWEKLEERDVRKGDMKRRGRKCQSEGGVSLCQKPEYYCPYISASI